MTTPFRDPRVRPQLQSSSPTRGDDCAFRCTQGILGWHGIDASISELRDKAGVASGGIGMDTVRDLLQGYGLAARFTTDQAEVSAALAAGNAVVCAINYGYLNAHPDLFPRLTGDRGFDGNHAVVAFGQEVVADRTWHELHDPLHDARRLYVPKANVMLRRKQLIALMAAMRSGTQGVIVRAPGGSDA